MKPDQSMKPNETVFLQTVEIAVRNLKQQLQHDYEQADPGLRAIIRLILDEEESCAWELTAFPHLVLPDLVEAHVAQLDLQPVAAKHVDVFAPLEHDQVENSQPVFALCA